MPPSTVHFQDTDIDAIRGAGGACRCTSNTCSENESRNPLVGHDLYLRCLKGRLCHP